MPCLALRRPTATIRLARRPISAVTAAVNAITKLFTAWRQRQYARACCASLARLDDRLLNDLGLTRGELASAASQLAAGERPKGWR